MQDSPLYSVPCFVQNYELEDINAGVKWQQQQTKACYRNKTNRKTVFHPTTTKRAQANLLYLSKQHMIWSTQNQKYQVIQLLYLHHPLHPK